MRKGIRNEIGCIKNNFQQARQEHKKTTAS